jgi:hypothetical protein
MRCLWFVLAGGCAALAAGPATAAPPDGSALIDRHLAAAWDKAKVKPAAPADDAEFLRRVYLDVAGRIPGATEARQFLDDKRPDKRQRLVEQLLGSPHYANHFTNVWRALLLPEVTTSIQAQVQLPSFRGWLRKRLAGNIGYDAMVRELIAAPISPGGMGKGFGYGGDGDASPDAFFFAKDLMPENLAAAASRVFLGVKLECAQCHDHPFATWKRDQFWSFAAFFSGVKRQGPGEVVIAGKEDPAKREIAIPNTSRTAKAKFLDGKEPAWAEGANARRTLAEWITKPDNPYFARAAVNRLWAYFFGTGLIDPVDEIAGGEHPATCPELLDDLAKAFAASKFDLKFLVRAIAGSRAYQLTSRGEAGNQAAVKLFARMAVRGLTAEQLFDSVAKATGFREAGPTGIPGVAVVGGPGNPREEFLARFAAAGDKPTEKQTSILQALTLMNSKLVADATSVEHSETLAGVVDAPFLDAAGKVEVLFLAALARRPTETETARVTKFIGERMHGAKDDGERQKRHAEALADLFWTLLNSGEFALNH